MNERHYLLGEVSKLLKMPPHRIAYLLSSGQVPEPTHRIANKRLFAPQDIERLAHHLGVPVPSLDPPEPAQALPKEPEPPFKPPYSVSPNGSIGHEVRDGDGAVVCWASDRAQALVIAGLLEHAAGGTIRGGV